MTGALLGRHPEPIFTVGAESEPVLSSNTRGILPEFQRLHYLPESAASRAPSGMAVQRHEGIADDNRTILLPGASVVLGGTTYYLSVKGVGTRSPMFGFADIFPSGGRAPWAGASLDEHWRQKAYNAPVFTGEMWFGGGPYGASGEEGPGDSVRITEMAGETPQNINGFWICPVLGYNRLPDWVVRAFEGSYWYRRWRAGWFQEIRLVPSDVRLYFHSEAPMGVKPQRVLTSFGVEGSEQLDAFIEKFIASGIAALTLAARTVRASDGGFDLLDYDDVWLDKDSVIAPDGTIHFADIDDIEWRRYEDAAGVRKKMARQFERNFYEFMFGLDSLMSERDRMAGRAPSVAQRRAELGARYVMALGGDRFARAESRADGVDLFLSPACKEVGEVTIRLVDFTGGA
jgi:hypothetical protein